MMKILPYLQGKCRAKNIDTSMAHFKVKKRQEVCNWHCKREINFKYPIKKKTKKT